MISFTKWVVVLFVLSLVGCGGTLGQLDMSTEQISVSTGEKIKQDPRKRGVLQEGHGVEHLHDFVLYYVNRNRMRQSLKFDITITTLRIGWGRDHMSTETVLMENGKEIERFTSVSTTSRSSDIIERFAKDLSKKIVTHARQF